ncbi:MAG TPA: caspase family protein, partial [Coleofasciculaceae cyanobacterium]
MCPATISTSRSSRALETGAAKLWILLVGVNRYQDESLPPLRYSALDCQGLGQALEIATQAFPNKEVQLYHDFAEQAPHLAAVRASLQQITTAAKPEDTVLFYFSGHGILEADRQQAVLCLADTCKDQLLTTGLPLQELLQQLGNCTAHQQLIWLDACHSGGMSLKGARGKPEPVLPNPNPQLVELLRQRAAQSQGFYALLSCDQSQRSWEFPELGHGVFTYYLMRGLRGEAVDAQGVIEADGLYKYVYHQTLQYIDKTNQQIRLVNQQKSSRGETQLQSEYPIQTPKRIVEGIGELVLGMRSPSHISQPRQALIIDGLAHHATTLAFSKVLRNAGAFELDYFPRPGKEWSEIRQVIQTCLSAPEAAPEATPEAAPEITPALAKGTAEQWVTPWHPLGSAATEETTTVLLYIRGQIETTAEGETWLRLGDGTRLNGAWLRQILRQSRRSQQIVILDCPGAVALDRWVDDLQTGSERGQCLIAAAAPLSQPDQFTQALLHTLDQADPQAGLTFAAWIVQLQLYLAGTAITPHIWLSAAQGVIDVLPGRVSAQGSDRSEGLDLGLCPYMGLQAFSESNAQYFYGREALTQQLLDQLNRHAALAIVGASGSGKSSVVQAGLLAQLRQGQQIPGSQQWWMGSLRPGSQPMEALAKRLVDPGTEKERAYQQLQIEGLLYQGVEGLVQWLRTRPEPMVVLVIDQFEELFTLAALPDRQAFLDLLLGAVNYAGDRFKLVFTLRADFIIPALEIPQLAQILQQSSVLVPPYLTEENYRQAIVRPAEQVGLRVEPGLVEVLLSELSHSAGDLPLLEFVLEQLWQRRQAGQLTLQAYQQIGGLKGALERQAQAVYDSLDPDAQACAQWIFLTLTQLGEGTEDTRRRILKSELSVAKYPAPLIERTLQALTAAKLVVMNLDEAADPGQSRGGADAADQPDRPTPFAATADITIEVAHEILIRYWSTLRWWLEENRTRLHLQRQLEQAALLWKQRGQQADFLLRGVRLAEAEDLYIKYTDELSDAVQQFIEAGLDSRQQEARQARQRLRRAQTAAAIIGGLGLIALLMGGLAYRQKLIAQIAAIQALDASSDALLWSNHQLESLLTSVKAGQQLQQLQGLDRWLIGTQVWTETQLTAASTLQQATFHTQELNRLEGHHQQVNAVQFNAQGDLLASASDDGTVKLWHPDGRLMATLPPSGSQGQPNRVTSVAFSPDGQTIATGNSDRIIRLWQISGDRQADSLEVRLSKTLTGHQDWITSLQFSPDGHSLASASRDQTVKLWRRDGSLIKTLVGHQGWVNQVRFSADGRTLASAGEDKTIRLWRPDGVLIKILTGQGDRVTHLDFSPDGQHLISASSTLPPQLWNLATGSAQPFEQAFDSADFSPQPVHSLRFSPDGKTVVTAGADGTIAV